MTKTKPTYKHPDFVLETADKRIENENKRMWLSLLIDKNAKENLLVILKNPSRATKDISDKTVFNVTNYIYKNREKYLPFMNVGTIIILNLIPFYQTYSELLATSNLSIIDNENLQTIKDLTTKHKTVIIAWGDPPKGLFNEYEELKKSIVEILKFNKNNVYYVDRLSKSGNPKHGQVWGYENKLLSYRL